VRGVVAGGAVGGAVAGARDVPGARVVAALATVEVVVGGGEVVVVVGGGTVVEVVLALGSVGGAALPSLASAAHEARVKSRNRTSTARRRTHALSASPGTACSRA
jgi:hypothetical protein